jgi:indole-3-pyruvate monooxygenase
VGNAWRHHYDRLHLHTPKSSSVLPGLAMAADWPRYPAREQVVDYLELYRATNGFGPHFGSEVRRLEQVDGEWVAVTSQREWRSSNVVIATGATR